MSDWFIDDEDDKIDELTSGAVQPKQPIVAEEQVPLASSKGEINPSATREAIGLTARETIPQALDVTGELIGGAIGSLGGPPGAAAGQTIGSGLFAGMGRFGSEFAYSAITGKEFDKEEAFKKAKQEALWASGTVAVAKGLGKGFELVIGKSRQLEKATQALEAAEKGLKSIQGNLDAAITQDMANLSKDLSKTTRQSQKAISRGYTRMFNRPEYADMTVDISDTIGNIIDKTGAENIGDIINELGMELAEVNLKKFPIQKAHELKQVLFKTGNGIKRGAKYGEEGIEILGKEDEIVKRAMDEIKRKEKYRELSVNLMDASDEIVQKVNASTNGEYQHLSDLWKRNEDLKITAKQSLGAVQEFGSATGEYQRARAMVSKLMKSGEDPYQWIQRVSSNEAQFLDKTLTMLEESGEEAFKNRAKRLRGEINKAVMSNINHKDVTEAIRLLERMQNPKVLEKSSYKMLLESTNVAEGIVKDADGLIADDLIKGITEKVGSQDFVNSSAFKKHLEYQLVLESLGLRQDETLKKLGALAVIVNSDISDTIKKKLFNASKVFDEVYKKKAPGFYGARKKIRTKSGEEVVLDPMKMLFRTALGTKLMYGLEDEPEEKKKPNPYLGI